MLQGKGTIDDPMISSGYRFMEATIMEDSETEEQRMVIIVEHEESSDLLAVCFSVDDSHEMAMKILKEIDNNG